MNKEQVYDEKISPLMAQIIDICKEHKISMICTFAIPTEEEPDLECTSSLIGKEFDSPPHHGRALNALYKTGSITMINTRDKDGKLINSTAVLS